MKQTIPIPRVVARLFPRVKFTRDADKPVEVSVQPQDCKDGTKLNPAECALARALKREFHADGVIIGMSTSYIVRGNTAIRFQTPQSVAREIVSFDRHQDFAAGDYHLSPMAPTKVLGYDKRTLKQSDNRTIRHYKRKIHKSARVRVLESGSISVEDE